MIKITDLNSSAIQEDFAISDLLGNFNIAEFSGKSLYGMDSDLNRTSFVQPVKMTITNANVSLSDDVIEKLLSCPKYIIGDMQTLSNKEPSLENLQDENNYINEKTGETEIIDYYSADQTDAGYIEYYAKLDQSLTNSGVFFMASEIDGNIHMFGLNVLESGQTGKSVTLTYLPNGKMENSILLERYCYHGTMGNDHKNPDGSIIHSTDIHLHKITEDFIDDINNNPKLDNQSKAEKLNFPPAKIIQKNVSPDKANISVMVENAMEIMNITDFILEKVGTDDNYTIVDSIKDSIHYAESLETKSGSSYNNPDDGFEM